MLRPAAAALLLLLLPQGAGAVQLYYGLDELKDLESVGIVDKAGTVQKHTLLAFSNHACKGRNGHAKGFPLNFAHLPGEGFELGQVCVCVWCGGLSVCICAADRSIVGGSR
jgi:hypothetical protein